MSKYLSLLSLIILSFIVTPSKATVNQQIGHTEVTDVSISKKDKKKLKRKKAKNERKKRRIKILAALGGIFGLLSIFTFSVFYISVVLAVLGVSLSAVSKNMSEKMEGGKKLGRWSLIGLILGGAMLAFWGITYMVNM